MKTEAEVKSRLAEFEALLSAPCGCKGPNHECTAGGDMMRASIAVLAWVVGDDNGSLDFCVSMMNSIAKLNRLSNPSSSRPASSV